MGFPKKYIIRAVILLPILLGVIYFWYRVPWGFHKEFQGIYFIPGNPEVSEKIMIRFDGYLQRGVWQDDVFDGKLTIGEKEMYVQLQISKKNRTYLMYHYNNTLGMYGFLYTRDIKKGFTISIAEEDERNPNQSDWSLINSGMISTPANNRSEALALSKRLIDPIWLEGSKE